MSHIHGLSSQEVKERLATGQSNSYKTPTSRSYWQILQENVFTFINSILLSIAIGLVLVNKVSDAFVYIVVALINILVGVAQEVKAKRQLDEIASLTKPRAVVVRDGQEIEVDTLEIVLGDTLVASSGDLIAVDGKVVAGEAETDESLLTGESALIHKQENSEVFSGSFVNTGKIFFVAEKVGIQSLANQLTGGAKAYRKVITPVQKEINLTVRILFFISILLGILNIFSSLVEQTPFTESLQITAVVLGIIPNSLFVMINLAYAVGAVAILRRGALIQQLNSVESLSHVDVLCVDKTGTLTTNRVDLVKIIPPHDNHREDVLADFATTITAPNRTIEAVVHKYPGTPQKIIQEVPFSSSYKWSGLSWENDSEKITCVIGAPEVLKNSVELSDRQKQAITESQSQGLRVLILAYNQKIIDLVGENKSPKLPEKLNFPAVLVFKNELRKEASLTLEKFKKAGVEIKIISGDNQQTVVALAQQLGMGQDIQSISGSELEKLSPSEFNEVVTRIQVFGRISPMQKESIIAGLKESGKYVAMIGDGVNDVLPLKKANLGISMQSGSQATRNVADIILLNDSFASLPSGVLEGQKIRNGLENIFKLYLTRVIYTILLIVATALASLPFPFTVKQTSLLATITTGMPALFLTIWTYPGVTRDRKLLSSVMSFVIPASLSIAMFATLIFFGFAFSKASVELSLQQAIVNNIQELRTILTSFVIFSGLVLVTLVAPPNKHFGDPSYLDNTKHSWKPTVLAISLMLIFTILLAIPNFRSFWELDNIGFSSLAIILLANIAWMILLQISWNKQWLKKFFS